MQLKVQNEEIPTVTEKPVKCLGKRYDELHKDHSNVTRMKDQLKEWMTVDKSKLPGKYKTWIYINMECRGHY